MQPFIITPLDERAADRLSKAAKERQLGIVLTPLKAPPKRVKEVLLRYPIDYKLTPIQDMEGVIMARRCIWKKSGQKIPTRNVEILFDENSLLETLDLCWFGNTRYGSMWKSQPVATDARGLSTQRRHALEQRLYQDAQHHPVLRSNKERSTEASTKMQQLL